MRLDPLIKEKLKEAFTKELVSMRSVVRITTAYPISKEEIADIMKHFPEYSKAQIETRTDPNIIGGFVLQVGSKEIDLSIRHALHSLSKKMYESN